MIQECLNCIELRKEIAILKEEVQRIALLVKWKSKDMIVIERLDPETWLLIDHQGFFGSRIKYYFPIFYYPIKILESQKLIEYGGSGIIKILDKFKKGVEEGIYK